MTVCSYSRNVVEFPRAQQASNPEVYVCVQLPSKYLREVRLLQYMTREMNSLTDTCSSDDEDCIDPPPTSLYYDLDTIDLTLGESALPTEEAEMVSGSGTDGDDVCQPVTTTTTLPQTLPTVGVGSSTGGSVPGGPGVGSSETPPTSGGDGSGVIIPGVNVNAQNTSSAMSMHLSGLTLTLSALLTTTALAFLHLTIH